MEFYILFIYDIKYFHNVFQDSFIKSKLMLFICFGSAYVSYRRWGRNNIIFFLIPQEQLCQSRKEESKPNDISLSHRSFPFKKCRQSIFVHSVLNFQGETGDTL